MSARRDLVIFDDHGPAMVLFDIDKLYDDAEAQVAASLARSGGESDDREVPAGESDLSSGEALRQLSAPPARQGGGAGPSSGSSTLSPDRRVAWSPPASTLPQGVDLRSVGSTGSGGSAT